MDAFSEILSGVKLNGAIFFTAEFSAPWGFSAPAANVIAATVAPAAPHLVLYHLVIEGGAVVELASGQLIDLEAGDVVIFPHGDAHHMSSGKGAIQPFPNYGITAKIKARDLSPLRAGGGGEISRFVCGYMSCDPYLSRPILNGFPPAFKVISGRIAPGIGWRVPSCTWSKKQFQDGPAAKPCLPSSRRPCSSTPCGATSPACRSNKRDGSRERAIPLSEGASAYCIAALPIRGRSLILRTKWAFRGPLSWSALSVISLSRP